MCGVIKWIDINGVTSESDDVTRHCDWQAGARPGATVNKSICRDALFDCLLAHSWLLMSEQYAVLHKIRASLYFDYNF